MASPSPSPGRRRATLSCALCGGAQVHPGPRVEAHLLNEHGVVLDVDFFVRVALFKRGHGRMPRLEGEEAKATAAAAPVPVQDASVQTEEEVPPLPKARDAGRDQSKETEEHPTPEAARESSTLSTRRDVPKSPSSASAALSSASPDATDLHCYFGCEEVFKKDFQLYLHLRLHHRSERASELRRAFSAAEEEVALTRRSGSVYRCALCHRQFTDNGAFSAHVQTKHSMQWREYKERYGRCEIESAPFQCQICGRVVKYDRNTVHSHLRNVHGINWTVYIDRIRKIRRGEEPGDLPEVEMAVCRVCNASVKLLRDHLKNAHKITEKQYDSLFKEDGEHFTPQRDLLTGPLSTATAALARPPKSDIQDKSNRRCSSCETSFDTRRDFLGHCSDAHGIKFKTRSGGSLKAAKRKEPAAPRAQSFLEPSPPPCKTAKEEFPLQEPGGEEVASPPRPSSSSVHMAPEYSPGGVSKWNQCRYECCFCKKSTMSRSSMTSHIHHTHGIPIKEYKEASYPDIEVETHWFQCRLCPGRTKFVKDCIAPHLKVHNMNTEEYEREVMQPEDWPSPPSPDGQWLTPTLRRTLGAETKSGAGVVTGEDDAPPPFLPSVENVVSGGVEDDDEFYLPLGGQDDKWNRCRFRCSLCPFASVDSRQTRNHIVASHHVPYDKYINEHGTTEVVTRFFICQLCGGKMKHCRQNIYAHCKEVHKLTLSEYEQQTETLDQELLQQQPEVQMQEGPLQQKNPLGESVDPGLLDEGNSPSRWNRCRFQCAICLKTNSEKRHTREHITKAHQMSMQEYEEQYGDCEVHTEFFRCAACSSELKHNMKNIFVHLSKVHSMNPEEYEDQYGRLPEAAETLPHHDQEPLADGADVTLDDDDEGDFEGFGAHFLLDDASADSGGGGQATTMTAPMPLHPPMPAPSPPPQQGLKSQNQLQRCRQPPRADVVNTSCKFCRLCDRTFKSRSIFLRHCRNVHAMKIRFAGKEKGNVAPLATGTKKKSSLLSPRLREYLSKAAAKSAPSSRKKQGNGRRDCEFCGKVFANRSNLGRHVSTSCEARKATFANSAEVVQDQDQLAVPPPPPPPARCPYPDCDATDPVGSDAQLERHLLEAHDIRQNVTVSLSSLEQEEEEGEGGKRLRRSDGGDQAEMKVPPLRVKLVAGGGGKGVGSGGDAEEKSPSEGDQRVFAILPEAASAEREGLGHDNLADVTAASDEGIISCHLGSSEGDEEEEEDWRSGGDVVLDQEK